MNRTLHAMGGKLFLYFSLFFSGPLHFSLSFSQFGVRDIFYDVYDPYACHRRSLSVSVSYAPQGRENSGHSWGNWK